MADAPTLDAGDATIDDNDLAVVERERYQVGRELSRGGLGRVMYGHDLRLDRVVAIKQLLAHNPLIEARFRREARITARLQHPGIVPIYEAGRWPSGEAFYAMKLVTGRSLKDELAVLASLDDRLALLPRVLAVCEAIAYAHNERIIHRDLKPANVMLGAFGEAYVVDWGLAKNLDGPAEPELPIATNDDGLTHMGSVLGTPPYLPPEQARGEPVDARADVYALGALLYQVLLGRQPYDRGEGRAIDRVIAGPPDPLAEREPGVPPELVAIVDKAMARDPADRYADAGELATDVRRFLTGQLVGAHRYSTRRLIARWVRRHRAVVIAAAVAVVAIATIATYSFSRVVDERDSEARRTSELYLMQARHALDVDPTAAIAWLKRHAAGVAPDAVAIREIGIDAASRGIASEVVRGIVGTDIADDGTVAGTDDENRVVIARAGARVEVVSPPIPASPIAIDSRGRWVAWSQPDIEIYDVASRTARVLAPAAGGPPNALRFVGDQLAIGDANGNVRLVAVTTGVIRVLAGHHAPIYDLAASKDGAWLASTARDATLWLWASDSGKGRELPADALVSSVSMSATRMAWGGGHVTVRWIDLASDAIHVGPTLTGSNVAVALSPDGRHLATSDETAIHEDDLETGAHRTFAAHTDWVDHLAFSADGATLVSSQSHGGPVIAWDLASAFSSGDPHPLLGHDHTVEVMRFVGDGTLVVADRSELRRWRLPPRGSHLISTGTHDWPEIATLANGGFVAVVGDGVSAFDTTATPHPITPAVALAAPFAASGDAVAFADRDGRVWLWIGGDHATLVGQGSVARDLAFDGTHIAVGGIDGAIEVWTPGHAEPMRFSGHAGAVIGVKLDGNRLVSAGDDSSVRTWDLATGATKVLADGGAAIECLAVGPGGTIAVGRDTGHVQLWSRDGIKSALAGHTAAVDQLAFVDANTLATASFDGTVRVWNLATGAARVLPHPGHVQALAVLGDGRLATGNAVEPNHIATIRVWDLDTATLDSEWRAHVQAIYELAVTRDHHTLISSGADSTARTWRLDVPATIPRANLAWLDGLSSAVLGPGDVVTSR